MTEEPAPAAVAPTAVATVTYDDFKKLDLRVGTIKAAERVVGSDKLLKLTVSLGSEERTLAAGLAELKSPEELVGRKIIVVANLAPRKLRGIESQGMLLAACPEGDFAKLALVSVEGGAEDGWKVY
ncbi:methionine--tRNA ligase subunit beta [Candidatus Micrarchaeota archaeon CG_4_10_14_0_2_um_filter_60_11]|nr:MAG: methionine--tRNA ligase subunit beta [Candidatus Micrarchaeota archaeon CG1_02_60_51]PIY91217.1 MAG: methionine--tRNA ligase subunit beta [Candidatus Micrarchaeota archaeon CG_4_10_14_0_8_um_filter_60_7]PIZ90769.1 MAG: methionine--tRNA ligase subunit beta [Candidatus Micrarchaeota archaeon CG_4_10_14_0_2_um_filter_60_11]